MTAWLRFRMIRRGLDIARPGRVLEVGAGEGALGAWLAARYEYVGIEPDVQSRRTAVSRLRALGRGEMLADLVDGDARSYDAVCAFEVLEHIEDDRQALAAWRSRLSPGGFLLLSVPAHASRFGPSDTYVGHFRRYDRSQLRERLEAEGFEVVRWQSYGAGLGQLLDAVRNTILRRRQASATAEERTAGSGRLFQPQSQARAFFNYLVALPFRALQAPFARTDVGIGYVVLARLRA
jgi:cyclopropane fatty-acyl-phospholipid synthase-like methyltransferase